MGLLFLLFFPWFLQASPRAEVGTGPRFPGTAIAIYFNSTPQSLSPNASGFQQKAAFYLNALSGTAEQQIAVLAIPLETKAGHHKVQIFWFENGAEVSEILRIRVIARPEKIRKLHLSALATKAASFLAEDKPLLKHAFQSAGGPPLWRGSFLNPVGSARVSEGFGVPRRYLPAGNISRHKGLDFAIENGSAVAATNHGVVVLAREDLKSYGGVVVISHGYDLCSSYMHLSKVLVKEAEVVEKGALIGLSGDKGIATGPHLHWQLNLRGHPVDPRPWMDKLVGADLR